MEHIKKAYRWLTQNYLPIVIGLIVFLYAWANVQAAKNKAQESKGEFMCQTVCFPQQHNYIYAGEAGSCWCYTDSETLRKHKED